MNKLSRLSPKLILIAFFWWFSLISIVRINFHPLDNPSFPYYNILLTKVQKPIQTVWAYFDGAHYIRLAEYGYVDVGTQAFFPLYPLLLRFVSSTYHLPIITAGQILNFTFLYFSLYLILHLFINSPWQKVLLLLAFPTSFFLVCVYTESLFLFLSLAFFLSLKNKRYLLAALFAGLASATRLVGVFLTLSLLTEILRSKSPRSYTISDWLYTIFRILISLSGFIAYAYFLWSKFGDPLMFLHVQSMFGASRSSGELVMLPQVLYRYAKMLVTVDPRSFLYQRLIFELITFIIGVIAWFYNLRKIPLSHSLYVASSIILPTLTGTLSSIPRYLLVLIPFLLPPKIKFNKFLLLLAVNLLLLYYLFALYSNGSFIA